MIYFDTSYLVRLYLDDFGAEAVRALVKQSDVACSLHGQTECIAALHRAFRERRFSHNAYLSLLNQFEEDDRDGAFNWLPMDDKVNMVVAKIYRKASAKIFLHAADALHLANARENGFKEIFSHDQRMIEAAPLFGLKGIDVVKQS